MTIAEEIREWKRKKDAVILAHYYVPGEVQEIADDIGTPIISVRRRCRERRGFSYSAGFPLWGRAPRF